jgi:uncharacterized damage-inducible protein DinB
MISVAHAKAMAAYNRKMNVRLYECCASLSDQQRKSDAGAFFKSIHGTLNHLLLGDRVWMGRFTSRPFAVQSLAQELYADFSELHAERVATDNTIVEWAATLTEANLAGDLSYVSRNNSTSQKVPLWFVVTHFFNHQTHHRGQLTTLLSQQGLDVGVTDLIAFPLST